MDKEDIKRLIELLNRCLEQRPEDMRELTDAEVEQLKVDRGDFDMLLENYAIINLRKRAFYKAVYTTKPILN